MSRPSEDSELSTAQKRGRLVTAFKNGCAHLKILVKQSKTVEAMDKLKRTLGHYDQFVNICDLLIIFPRAVYIGGKQQRRIDGLAFLIY